MLNKPVLTTAFLVLISGILNTELGKSLRIEFYSPPTLNVAGNAEGQNFLGAVQVNTATANTVVFSTFLQTTKAAKGSFMGNTSEFSLAQHVSIPEVPPITPFRSKTGDFLRASASE